jgi:uncharacterized protein (TIGR04255 family)
MHMTESLGTWKNAPLAYVLAEVRTELLADLKEYQPKLAAALRGSYPIQRVLHAARFVATSGGIQHEPEQDGAAWEFASPNNQTAVIIRSNGIVLHATTYAGSGDFLERLNSAILILAREVPSVYVNRLGLRYVDFIIPKPGETPDAYIDAKLNPTVALPTAIAPPFAMSLAIYPVREGKLSLRYMRGSGRPELPPDLATFALEKSSLMRRSDIAADQATAIVDTDRIRDFATRIALDPNVLKGEFRIMHGDVSSAFMFLLTEYAKKQWEVP